MLTQVVTPPGTGRLPADYADYLIAAIEKQCSAGLQTLTNDSNELKWNNPENIDTGLSGLVLLLMEFYAQPGNEKYLRPVNDALDKLVDHCRKNETFNYSLYTGRAGVVYVMMRWYAITKNKLLLDQCLELIAPAGKDYLYSKYTSDYLYDGRAGTLLVILHLYLLTKENFLLEYIDKFLHKIIYNSSLAPEGISWTSEEEINLRPSCGFAHGTAGIKYVLCQVNKYINSSDLLFIISEIDRYQQSCRVEELQCWSDSRREILNKETLEQYLQSFGNANGHAEANYGWANGMTGILFSYLFAPDENIRETVEHFCSAITKEKFKTNELFNGLAGWGLYALEACKDGGSQVQDILSGISGKVFSGKFNKNINGGLLHGEPGVVYFLLKAAGNSGTENILSPFLHVGQKDVSSIDIPINRVEMKRAWLARHYPRTVSLLQKIVPDMLRQYLEKPADNLTKELIQFGHLIRNTNVPGANATAVACVTDLYELEKARTEFLFSQDASTFNLMMREWIRHKEVLENLNKPIDWLMSQKVFISPNIRVLTSRWNWSFNNHFDEVRENAADNFKYQPGNFEYIVHLSKRGELAEFPMQMDTSMLLHLFSKPKLVRDAMKEIKQYVQSLPKDTMQQVIFSLSGNSNALHFVEQLDNLVLFKVRQWIYRGIFSVA